MITAPVFAQTKLIAHKSHSGTWANFNLAMENNPGQYNGSNFGVGPEPTITSSQLDSVKYISDTLAIMYTSRYCSRGFSDERETKWRPGEAFVYNHPLFSKKHALDSIKSVLMSQYYFRNSIKKVKFIGYDNNPPVIKTVKKDTVIANIPPPVKDTVKKIADKNQPKIHLRKKSNISSDMIWLLEMVSLMSMAAGFSFIKMR